MRRGRSRNASLILVAGLAVAGPTGCHQHHYYLTSPQQAACTTPQVSTIAYGDVCTVPEGTVVASNGGPLITSGAPLITRSSSGPVVIAGAPGSTPMVVSQPRTGLLSGRVSRSWRASDPEQRVTLKADGAYDDVQMK